MHWAAKRGYGEIIEKIVECKGDINAKDMTGKTPLMVALRAKQGRAVEVSKHTYSVNRV